MFFDESEECLRVAHQNDLNDEFEESEMRMRFQIQIHTSMILHIYFNQKMCEMRCSRTLREKDPSKTFSTLQTKNGSVLNTPRLWCESDS